MSALSRALGLRCLARSGQAVSRGPCLLREAVGDHRPIARAACVRDRRRKFLDNTDRGNEPDHADGDPRPAAVTFVTTEHFTLQGARSSTISESTGRASVFLGAVSGGLIALGLVATAAKTGVAFYMFGLILLPTRAFVGLATFHRVLQSGIEDLGYARRITIRSSHAEPARRSRQHTTRP